MMMNGGTSTEVGEMSRLMVCEEEPEGEQAGAEAVIEELDTDERI